MKQELSFGAFVRHHRREMDLTQEELARRVGCAAITLRKIEADDLRASVQIAERLAMALAIPLEERAEFVRWARSVRPASAELPPVTPAPTMEEIGREDLTGRAIRGYALAERIGMGGMGSVYRAVQPNVERDVAVKIILPAFANHPDFIRRFETEAQLVARLEHPHIVPLYDYWREPGMAYLVMRLLRGGNIQHLLGQGALSIEMTTRLLEQICSALNTAHRIGIIHRDLKPANVLLDEDGNAYLADFGIAKNLGDPDLENQTQIDAIIGSPQYMSPEQIRSLSVRPQTDIYCLGVMLYEMLTGSLPFTGPTPFDTIQQHINTPLPPLSAHRAGLPAALDAVVACATAKDPQDRYSDALLFFQDFRRAVDGMVNLHTLPVSYEEEESDFEMANPFKGLRAFGEADAENFFGRETFIQQLLMRLGEGGDLRRFLAVIGPSGSGKSSVVRAGLIPALRRGALPGSENWFFVDMLPGKHPFEELEASLLRVAVNPPESLLSQFKDGNRGLLRAVHRILPADESVELVLLIDQFEEVFTLIEDETERALFLESLAAAVLDERSRLHVIVTLRADFTDKPLRYVDFGELLNRRFEFVLPLTPDEVERAVAGPAQRVGLKLEKGLVSTIIRDAGNQPGTLPLLQYALSELFEKREGRLLTHKAYREIGGVAGALGRSAEMVFADLDEAGEVAARQLFLRLVTLGEGTEDTRRRALRAEIEALHGDQQLALRHVIQSFGNARLLSFDRDPMTRGATIEVAHEALLREWVRLREWLNESRGDIRLQRQLAAVAQEWQNSGHDLSFLMTGSRLEQFEGWSDNTTVALTAVERTYLGASIAERDRREAEERERMLREMASAQKLAETERQSVVRLRFRNRLITAVGIIAMILAVAALSFSNQANANAVNAEKNAELALNAQATAQTSNAQAIADFTHSEALRLATEANSVKLNNGDPNLVALLSIQSLNMQYTPSGDAMLTSLTSLQIPPQVLSAHTEQITDFDISRDGRYLATASDDTTARLWDLSTGETIHVFSHETSPVWGVAFSPDGKSLATTGVDGTLRLWNVVSGEGEKVLSAPTELYLPAFSPDGRYIIALGLDPKALIWDVSTGQVVQVLTGHTQQLNRAVYSPDGRYVLTGSNDNTARLWDADTGEELQVFAGHTNGVGAVAFSPDEKYIATGDDYVARLWDLATGQIVHEFSGHQDTLSAIQFSLDGQLLLTGSRDNTARFWDIGTGETTRIFGGNTGWVQDVAFTPDGAAIITVGEENGVAKIWNLQTFPGGMQYAGHDGPVWQASFSPDGRQLVTTGNVGSAQIWDTATGQTLMTFPGHTAVIRGAILSPDGTRVLTTSVDATAILWDAATGKEVRQFNGHTEIVNRGVFSPDGRNIITTSYDGTARVWDAETGQTILIYTGQGPGHVNRIAFSPDGKTVVTSGDDGTARIWDPLSGRDVMVFRGHTDIVAGVAFSPDGKLLVTSSFDGSVRLWDVATGEELHRFPGHPDGAFGAAISPDGKYVVSSGADGTARLWNLKTGEEVRRFTGHSGWVRNVTFSPDGKYILTASDDNTARLWQIDLPNTLLEVCALLTRALTDEERLQFGISDQEPTCPAR